MSKLTEIDKPPIEPVYSQTCPNERIVLADTRVQSTHRDRTYERTAKVVIQFLPRDYLLFVVPAEDMIDEPFWTIGTGHSLIREKSIQLRLIDKSTLVDVFCKSVGVDGDEVVFTPRKSVITVAVGREHPCTVMFHVFNFPDFWGSEDYILTLGKPPLPGGKRCGRVILQAGGWCITIAATDKTEDLTKSLQKQGGYVITHMGKIEREDSSAFSIAQAEYLLSCLRQFLSFALGRRIGIALPIGLDINGQRVFEQWDLPLMTAGSWNGSYSWFDSHHGSLLSEVFPGFFSRWCSDSWKEHLKVALYWYLAANERTTGIGVDAGIILAQTALERLAWAYCVEERGLLSPKAYWQGGLSAAKKFRLLASTLGVPIGLPQNLTVLNTEHEGKWSDTPSAIAFIRNALVHPSKSKSFIGGSHYYEAWQLSMWLLDLVLLRLCNHTGPYANRLADERWVGSVEQVPWAKH